MPVIFLSVPVRVLLSKPIQEFNAALGKSLIKDSNSQAKLTELD